MSALLGGWSAAGTQNPGINVFVLKRTYRFDFARMCEKGNNMPEYDDKVVEIFLEKQLQLFPEEVAQSKEEALEFLSDCMAVVVDSKKEVWDYFDEEGVDISGMSEEELLSAQEVFDLEDGRYLIVES